MQLTERLSHIEYLQVTGSDSCEVFCGSDQEWFPTERQRLTGCGPSAAANILLLLLISETGHRKKGGKI